MLPNFMAEKLIINYEDYKLAVEKLALTIEKNYKPSVLVGIMRGAAPIIDMLSRIFKLPTAYVVIQSYSGETVENKQGELIFARDISSIAKNEDFKNVLLVDDLSDTGLTLNENLDWWEQSEKRDYVRKQLKSTILTMVMLSVLTCSITCKLKIILDVVKSSEEGVKYLLLWYFLSEVYFLLVVYILISHFLRKKWKCSQKTSICNFKSMET